MATKVTLKIAQAYVNKAKAAGGHIICTKCQVNEARWLLSCPDGSFQGTGCESCWVEHQEFVEFSMILIASGMAEAACCSRCGADPVSADHIIITEIA